MAMGADYSFELISIETYAPQFIGHNKLFLGSVFGSVPIQAKRKTDKLSFSTQTAEKGRTVAKNS